MKKKKKKIENHLTINKTKKEEAYKNIYIETINTQKPPSIKGPPGMLSLSKFSLPGAIWHCPWPRLHAKSKQWKSAIRHNERKKKGKI